MEIENSFLYSSAGLLFPGTEESSKVNCAWQKRACESFVFWLVTWMSIETCGTQAVVFCTRHNISRKEICPTCFSWNNCVKLKFFKKLCNNNFWFVFTVCSIGSWCWCLPCLFLPNCVVVQCVSFHRSFFFPIIHLSLNRDFVSVSLVSSM